MTTPLPPHIRFAVSHHADTTTSVTQVLTEVAAAQADFTLLFFDETHDPQLIASLLDQHTAERGLGACTRHLLDQAGDYPRAVMAMSFCDPQIRAVIEIVPQLANLSLLPLVHLPEQMIRRLGRTPDELSAERHLWLTLIDGQATVSTLLVSFFSQLAPKLTLVGGSISSSEPDELCLVHHGRTYREAAAFVLLEYPFGFETFHCMHHNLSDTWLTITRASQDGMVIEELDDRPARAVYAEQLQLDPDALTAARTMSSPLGMRFKGRAFPVGVVEPVGEGLRLGLPIQVGDLLNVLEPGDMVEESEACLESALERLGAQAPFMLLFECIGLAMEAEFIGRKEEFDAALRRVPLIGIHSLGEQYGALHCNHSLTGVVFG